MKRQWREKLPVKKNYSLIIGFLCTLGITLYPSLIHPMLFPEGYKKIQGEARKGIRQEDVQPGNMKIWSDPFDRRKQIVVD